MSYNQSVNDSGGEEAEAHVMMPKKKYIQFKRYRTLYRQSQDQAQRYRKSVSRHKSDFDRINNIPRRLDTINKDNIDNDEEQAAADSHYRHHHSMSSARAPSSDTEGSASDYDERREKDALSGQGKAEGSSNYNLGSGNLLRARQQAMNALSESLPASLTTGAVADAGGEQPPLTVDPNKIGPIIQSTPLGPHLSNSERSKPYDAAAVAFKSPATAIQGRREADSTSAAIPWWFLGKLQ
jgi:hypothetical protein